MLVKLKNKSFLLLSIILITYCQSKPKRPDSETLRFDIVGTWILSDYKAIASKSKSGLAAERATGDFPSCLFFSKDEVPCSFGLLFNTHQGGGNGKLDRYSEIDSCLYARDGDKTYFKLLLKRIGMDTFLVMRNFPGSTRDKFFVRISRGFIANPFGFVFNALIFSGKYDVFDASRRLLSNEFILDDLGNVRGSNVFKKYSVSTDFATQEEPTDEIIFDSKFFYEYEFKGSTIYLYEEDTVAPGEMKRGALKYVLERR
jgi:hypothetical protein